MGITAISPISAASANANPNTTTERPTEQAATASTDTVQLSVAQQVYQLYNQGQQVSQIAQSLSLSVGEVNSYLSLSNSA
jgi:DNA-binding CsgD family transcriptional regulator